MEDVDSTSHFSQRADTGLFIIIIFFYTSAYFHIFVVCDVRKVNGDCVTSRFWLDTFVL